MLPIATIKEAEEAIRTQTYELMMNNTHQTHQKQPTTNTSTNMKKNNKIDRKNSIN